MGNSWTETVTGTIVVIICIIFLVYGYRYTDTTNRHSYQIQVTFANVDGLVRGSNVRLAGIKIGTVTKEILDKKTYQPIVTLNINDDIKIPNDSSAKITSVGLLGENYISIVPGGSTDYLKNGERLLYSQGSVDIVSMLGHALLGIGQTISKSKSQ